jgi:hypothetical protein
VDDPSRPVLLALSDNGPQMTSGSTREFMALCAIHQHFGRPGIPTDQAWIESLFGHVKAEWPHLNQIRDPAVLRAELALVRERYNGVRLHAGIGYVTPNDEHQGRGPAIRKARQAGLEQARLQRLAWHREHHQSEPSEEPGDVTKGYEGSWIFEPVLTWANALQRVQCSAFSLVADQSAISIANSETGQYATGAGIRTACDRRTC